MAFNKKLITNNASIRDHAFYHPDKIFIWGEDERQSMARFLSSEHQETDLTLLERYCADGMLKTLVGAAVV